MLEKSNIHTYLVEEAEEAVVHDGVEVLHLAAVEGIEHTTVGGGVALEALLQLRGIAQFDDQLRRGQLAVAVVGGVWATPCGRLAEDVCKLYIQCTGNDLR